MNSSIQRRNLILAAGITSFVAALLVLGVLAWNIFGTDVIAERKHAETVTNLKDQWAKGEGHVPTTSGNGYNGTLPGDPTEAAPVSGAPFALIYIPRFGKDYVEPVIEATSLNQLSDGVGHGLGTALPGQLGNVGLAGHRTTWGEPFRNIDKLKAGDEIRIVTAKHTYVYRVTKHEIVKPEQVDVWAPVPRKKGAKPTKRMLTLSACHPLYSAAERYIVYAEQVSAT